ncbi:MAG: hypothetical protein ACREMT_09265, partial [Vulcanimicrobiaceae bacterium]
AMLSRNLPAMPFMRVLIPLLFVGIALAAAAGCSKNGTSVLTSPTASPITAAPCSGCTPLPTASAGTPSPIPSAYQPLANGDSWSFGCTTGTAMKNVATNGNQFNDTLTVTAEFPSAITAIESTDGIGNTNVSGWIVGASTTTVSPAGLEFGPTLIANAPTASTFQAPVTGTMSAVYVQTLASLTVPAGTYNNVVEFKLTDSSPIFPNLAEMDVYAVLGVGPIQIVFPNPPDTSATNTCQLSVAPTLH